MSLPYMSLIHKWMSLSKISRRFQGLMCSIASQVPPCRSQSTLKTLSYKNWGWGNTRRLWNEYEVIDIVEKIHNELKFGTSFQSSYRAFTSRYGRHPWNFLKFWFAIEKIKKFNWWVKSHFIWIIVDNLVFAPFIYQLLFKSNKI